MLFGNVWAETAPHVSPVKASVSSIRDGESMIVILAVALNFEEWRRSICANLVKDRQKTGNDKSRVNSRSEALRG